MPKISISENQINTFITAMNHRMTSIEEKAGKIEIDVKWIKKITWYFATILTGIFIKIVFI